MDGNYLIYFGLGALGALVIVWLRWIGTLPRFKSAIEIAPLENEYEVVSKAITEKFQEKQTVPDSEVNHSNMLRDDIWRQRCYSFFVSACMYVILGGATALIFIGPDLTGSLDSAAIIKLISAGAMWSTFYSFIETKNVEKNSLSKMGEVNDAMFEYFRQECSLKLQRANENIELISDRYNELVDEYQSLLRTQKATGE